MAQRRGGSSAHRTAAINRTTGGRTANSASNGRTAGRADHHAAYVYDNTARQLEIVRQLQEAPKKQLSHETRKNRDKATHMNVRYVLFLAAALCVCAMMLMRYVELQSDLTSRVKEISDLERRLNNLQLSNEEDYNRVVSSIDLEEIRKVAIGELGMTYAKEGQIIKYEKAGSDYMRKVSE